VHTVNLLNQGDKGMSRKVLYTATVTAAIAGLAAGIMIGHGAQAATEDPALTAAARLGITAFENDAEVGGGGAPEKLLLDNDVVRVNLVSFPKGFDRKGRLKRRYNQLLVYIDPGDYTITWSGTTGKPPPPRNKPHVPLPVGSAVYHPAGTVVSDSHINNAYRVLFIEMKK